MVYTSLSAGTTYNVHVLLLNTALWKEILKKKRNNKHNTLYNIVEQVWNIRRYRYNNLLKKNTINNVYNNQKLW